MLHAETVAQLRSLWRAPELISPRLDIAGVGSPAVIYSTASREDGHYRVDEVGGARTRRISDHCKRTGARLADTPMTRNPGRWNEARKEAGKRPDGDNPKEEGVIAAARLPTSVMKIPRMQPSDVAPAQ